MNKQELNMAEIRGKIIQNVENLQSQKNQAAKELSGLDQKINDLSKLLKKEGNYKLTGEQKQARSAMMGRIKTYKEERKELRSELKGFEREIKQYQKGAGKTVDKIEKMMQPKRKHFWSRKKTSVDPLKDPKIIGQWEKLRQMNNKAFDPNRKKGDLSQQISERAQTIRDKGLEVEDARESHNFQMGLLKRIRDTKVEAKEVKKTIDKQFKGPEEKHVRKDTGKLYRLLEKRIDTLNEGERLTGNRTLGKSERNQILSNYKEARSEFRERRQLLEKSWNNRREIRREADVNYKKFQELERKKNNLEKGLAAKLKAKLLSGGKKKRSQRLESVKEDISVLKERTRKLKDLDGEYKQFQNGITSGEDVGNLKGKFSEMDRDFTARRINFPEDPVKRAQTERRKKSFDQMKRLSSQNYKMKLADVKNPAELETYLKEVLASGTKEKVEEFSKTVGTERLSDILNEEMLEILDFYFRNEVVRFDEIIDLAESTLKTEEDYRQALEALQDIVGEFKDNPAMLRSDRKQKLQEAREKLEEKLEGYWKLNTPIRPRNVVSDSSFWSRSENLKEFQKVAVNFSRDTKKYRNYLQDLLDNTKVKGRKRIELQDQINILDNHIQTLEKLERLEPEEGKDPFKTFSELFDRKYVGELYEAFIPLKEIHKRSDKVPYINSYAETHFGNVAKGIDSHSIIFVQLPPRFELLIRDMQNEVKRELREDQKSGLSDLLTAIQIGNQQFTASQ